MKIILVLAVLTYLQVAYAGIPPPSSSEPCPTGTYSGTGYYPSCIPCDTGTYQNETGSTSCKPCDMKPNMVTMGNQKSSVSDCLAPCQPGYYSPHGYDTCIACPQGKYSDRDTATECTECSEHTTTLGTAAKSSDECSVTACAPGQWSPSGFDFMVLDEDQACKPCPVGFYQPESQQNSCLDCGPDTSTKEEGSISDSECKAQCEPGHYSATGLSECNECNHGEYQPKKGKTTCLVCEPEGSYTTINTGSIGSFQCVPKIPMCKEGYFSETGYEPCTACSIGSYQDQPGHKNCQKCPFGLTTEKEGSVTAGDCSGLCRPGQFSSDGKTPCQNCPIGTYQPRGGESFCRECPENHSTVTIGQRYLTSCKAFCPLGTYSPTGLKDCDSCIVGTYSDKLGSKNCTACPTKTSTYQTGTTSSSLCTRTMCEPGYYSADGYEPCEPCIEGFYQDMPGQKGCRACPQGSVTINPGANSKDKCVGPCPAGSYSENMLLPCTLCPYGQYQLASGQIDCEVCPDGETTARRGAVSPEACVEDNSVDRDPHFMLSSRMTGHHMCFDFDGFQDEVMVLVEDDKRNIVVNGELFETKTSTKEEPQSYFSDIAIMAQGHLVRCSDQFIKINNDVYSWDQVIDHSYDNIELMSEGTNFTTVAIHPDVTFMVTRAYGSAVGYFLGLYILKSRGLSNECTGVIGQFVHTDFAADISNDEVGEEGMLFFNDDHEPVPVSIVKRYNKVAKSLVSCWLYKPADHNQDMLLGKREKYMMIDLESPEHKYEAEKSEKWWPF